MPGGPDVKHTFLMVAPCDLRRVDDQEYRISTLFLRENKCLPPTRFTRRTPWPGLSSIAARVARRDVSAAMFPPFAAGLRRQFSPG